MTEMSESINHATREREVISDAAVAMFEPQGLRRAPAARYRLYHAMLEDPTIALARAIVVGSVQQTQWSWQSRDDASAEMVSFITSQVSDLRDYVLHESMRAIDFGWQAFEKIYAYERGRWVLRKLKALEHEETEILVDRQTGEFAGVRQGKVVLPPVKCFVFTHDRVGDNYYGRSRLEHVREVWDMWRQANETAARYDRKVAGVMPVVHYPPGQSMDQAGRGVDNFEIARRLLESVSSGKGLAVPNEFAAWAEASGGDGPEKRRWLIELLEDRGSRQPGFVERLRYLDSLKFRGYLRPERSALEGSRGTLAEAKAHQDVGQMDSVWLSKEITRHVNWYLVDELLALNFGESARGLIRAEVSLDPGVTGLEMLKALNDISSNERGDEILNQVDFRALLQRMGVPLT